MSHHLWSWVHVPKLENQALGEKMMKMLKSPRMAHAREIGLNVDSLLKDLLQATLLHQGLQKMEICGNSESFPIELGTQRLQVQALTKMKSVVWNFMFCPLQSAHIPLCFEISTTITLATLLSHSQTRPMHFWDRACLIQGFRVSCFGSSRRPRGEV